MIGIIWFVLLVVFLVLQATIIPLLAISTIRPDLLLIITVSTGLLMGKEQGVGVGFFAGLLQDLSSGNIFGLNILAKMAVGYLFGMAERKVFKEHILLPLLAVIMATVVHYFAMAVFLYVFKYKADLFTNLPYNLLPIVAYNVCFAIPIHWLVYKISSYQMEQEQ